MALSFSNLASTATATDATSYALPAVNVNANSLLLYSINVSRAATPGAAINITGLAGATWTAVENIVWNTTASPTNRLAVFRTMVAASANSITLNTSFAGDTQTGIAHGLDEITGCATSGTDGSGAI